MTAAASPAGAAGDPTPRDGLVACGLLAVATVVNLLLDAYVSLTSQAMVYVLAVVVASYQLGRLPSVLAAVAAVTLLNFFFIEPRHTFQVDARENVFALFAMLGVALVISHLGTQLRRETDAARVSERRARQLQQMAAELAAAATPAQVQALAQENLDRAFAAPCVVALLGEGGELQLRPEDAGQFRDGMLACMREAATLGPGTGRWPGLMAWYLPLRAEKHVSGAACVRNVTSQDEGGREHAQAICTLAGEALWRLELSTGMRQAQEQSQWHRAQSTFLAAISHDFRTPLAAIVGAASSLQTQADRLQPAQQARLLATIVGEARHLATLTENTLQLVRLDHAGELHRDWESVEEIVGSVLARVRERDVAHRIRSHVPPGLPLIKADPVLLAQLLENLLDNALKYSADVIEVEAREQHGRIELAVHDRGSGVPAGQDAAIFEPYHRGDRSGQRGAGLGLAVCRAIARAHGGELSVRSRPGGGSSFLLALPLEPAQPAMETAQPALEPP
jgi:two-component system, OmpR family, sensor histidine kinase KdpD